MSNKSILIPALIGPVIVTIASALGYAPTRNISGDQITVGSVAAGCAAGVLANWLGVAVFMALMTKEPEKAPTAVMLTEAIRFLAILFFAIAGVFSRMFEIRAFLIWAVVSYLIMLLVVTVWLVRMNRKPIEE